MREREKGVGQQFPKVHCIIGKNSAKEKKTRTHTHGHVDTHRHTPYQLLLLRIRSHPRFQPCICNCHRFSWFDPNEAQLRSMPFSGRNSIFKCLPKRCNALCACVCALQLSGTSLYSLLETEKKASKEEEEGKGKEEEKEEEQKGRKEEERRRREELASNESEQYQQNANT